MPCAARIVDDVFADVPAGQVGEMIVAAIR